MSKQVVIYTTPTCSYCQKAKALFEAAGVVYTEKDVLKDKIAAGVMVQKSGQLGVPVITVDGEIVVGFNQTKLRQLLEI